VLWYGNLSNEAAQSQIILLRHKRKIVRLTVDLEQWFFCVQKCCNSGRGFITKYGRHSKQKAAENPTALCLKQHTIPHCADIPCWVLKQERNRALRLFITKQAKQKEWKFILATA